MITKKFIVNYKYLNKIIVSEQIVWSFKYLKKISNKKKLKISFSRASINFNKSYIFLFDDINILKKNFDIKTDLPFEKESFVMLNMKIVKGDRSSYVPSF